MNAPLRDSAIRLSADVGGTFTDVAAFDEKTGALRLGKTLTTPSRLVAGIETGVGKAGAQFSAAQLFLHGTTVAINTILERNGAPCALLTTQGFRDIYEIGRVNRPESYNLFFQKHEPLIDRDLRFEILERMDAQGTVLIPLDEDQVRDCGAGTRRAGVQAIAILFLHSYRNPAHEKRAKSLDRAPNSRSSSSPLARTSQEYREYERTSTAAANAYVGPRVQRYLTRWKRIWKTPDFAGNFLMVQSTGGLFDVEEARHPASACWNPAPPPASSAPRRCAIHINIANAIAFDMGGTTAKAGVIYEGNVLMTGAALIGGYATGLPVQMPMIDIQEVGTGGGSIARIEVGTHCASARKRPARRRARSATASAAPSRPSPTPTWCSAGWRRPLPRRRDEARPRRGESRATRRSRCRSGSIPIEPPTASSASPPRRWRMWCAG